MSYRWRITVRFGCMSKPLAAQHLRCCHSVLQGLLFMLSSLVAELDVLSRELTTSMGTLEVRCASLACGASAECTLLSNNLRDAASSCC